MLSVLIICILDSNTIILKWELRWAEHHTLTIVHRTDNIPWEKNKLEMIGVWKWHHPQLCKNSICVSSQTDVSPGTMSDPDRTVSMGVLSGGGVSVQVVDIVLQFLFYYAYYLSYILLHPPIRLDTHSFLFYLIPSDSTCLSPTY